MIGDDLRVLGPPIARCTLKIDGESVVQVRTTSLRETAVDDIPQQQVLQPQTDHVATSRVFDDEALRQKFV